MKPIKIIHTEEEHEQALARALQLVRKDPAPATPEGDELELLSFVIERYEQQHFPRNATDPIQAIKFMMDQQGLKKKDLTPYIGSAPKVTEVLNGKRTLSLGMIRRLSAGLGIPVSVLIQEPNKKRA